MTPVTLGIGALLLGLVFGTIAVWGAPIFAIPIVVIGLTLLGVGQMRRRSEQARSMKAMREEAAAENVEFTERDRHTLA